MKKTIIVLSLVTAAGFLVAQTNFPSQPEQQTPVYEYATARFMAGNKTCIVWPDRSVELLAKKGERRPDETDERMFWMSVVLNTLAKKGYEPIPSPMQSTVDDIVARRIKR